MTSSAPCAGPQGEPPRGLQLPTPMENPYCSCNLARGEPPRRPTAAIPVENPCCSCKLTGRGAAGPTKTRVPCRQVSHG